MKQLLNLIIILPSTPFILIWLLYKVFELGEQNIALMSQYDMEQYMYYCFEQLDFKFVQFFSLCLWILIFGAIL